MAQLNITLNQEEILQLLSGDRDEAFKKLLTESLNSILKAESAQQLGAEPYERTSARTDSRNGSRERELNTRIGTIVLTVPRHRNQPFRTLIFDNYKRSEAALVSCMAEMVVNGVSTRKVTKVVETLCGTAFSKSSVSEVCRELDQAVHEFKNRYLDREYPFIFVDATYFKVRISHRVTTRAFMIAMAINSDGKREIIGFESYDNESKKTWKAFFKSLKERGLSGLKVVTSDAHEGIIYGLSKTFPDVPWQRCQVHFSRNVLEHAPSKYQTEIRDRLTSMYNASSIKEARRLRDCIINDFSDVAGKAMECLDNGFESSMTVMCLPKETKRYLRTTNVLERVNKELKRRSRVIGIFPNEKSIIRLMGSILLDIHNSYSVQSKVHIPERDMKQLPEYEEELKQLAKEQHKMMAA